jgi:lipid II:glycine glycyltransferase (peptidoglycan interpeptide bridge formation enzyme)
VQPRSWFQNVIDSLGDRVVVHVAKHEGRPVAAIVTAAHKRTLVYKYGCSDVASNRLGAMSFLFWRAIQTAKEQGPRRSSIWGAPISTIKDCWRSKITWEADVESSSTIDVR